MVDSKEEVPGTERENNKKMEQDGTRPTTSEDGDAAPSQQATSPALQEIKSEEVEIVNGEALGEASSQSDTTNSIPVINLPDDIKNEDVKPICFDEVSRSGPTINRPNRFL